MEYWVLQIVNMAYLYFSEIFYNFLFKIFVFFIINLKYLISFFIFDIVYSPFCVSFLFWDYNMVIFIPSFSSIQNLPYSSPLSPWNSPPLFSLTVILCIYVYAHTYIFLNITSICKCYFVYIFSTGHFALNC